MSTSNDLDAPADNATVPSLAEARARLLADESLSLPRRRDMASALTSLAKAIGRPPETVAAAPATLRPLLAGLTPAMVGCRPGRWRNVLSLATGPSPISISSSCRGASARHPPRPGRRSSSPWARAPGRPGTSICGALRATARRRGLSRPRLMTR